MSDANHERLRRLFDHAIDLPPAERPTFVASACGDDDVLAQRLLAMLAAVDDEQFLAKATAAPRPGPAPALGDGPGDRIGPYLLLRQLGEGGFGVVFLAEQHEPVQRQVALKILKPGMDTRQVVARFQQERQALALMDHPNIARVLDAGTTAHGRPYFVMDLVPGEPITAFCDAHRLPVEERLHLFAQVCQAVQHAHAKGIIHRDLKPSNVLVAVADGRPTVKVIDFGIAKATAQRLTGGTLFTEHLQVLGTLQYMSPEQAEGSPDIDTRADVYALGILLYELLTGSTPFDRQTLQGAVWFELQRLIREVEPPRPSTRLSQSRDTIASIAAQRRSEPRRLGSRLRGDLDWIVMKALEKDRTRRYETASSLALDIQRHLDGDAVTAAPPGAVYRLRKFVRRNRGAVAALLAVAASLVAGVVAFAWQARIATARSAELAQVVTFQERMLGQLDATAAGLRLMQDIRTRHGTALAASSVPESERAARAAAFAQELARVNATDTAVAIVETSMLHPAVGAVERQFAQQPLVAATLRQTLAGLYARLGRLETAQALQQQAADARRQLLGADALDTAQANHDLGTILEKRGRYREAEAVMRQALAVRRARLGDDCVETMTALGNLGGNLRYQGRLAEAEPLLEQALRIARAIGGDEHRDTLVRLNVLGYLRIDQGRPADAEPLWREAYATGTRVFGADDPDVITWTNNLGGLLGTLGKVADSERYYRQAWTAATRVHGEEHPATSSCANNVAICLMTQGRAGEAEPIQRQAVASRQRVLGPDHPETLDSMRSLGRTLAQLGRFDEAERLLRDAFAGHQRVSGPIAASTLDTGGSLASMLADSGQAAAAETLYRQLLTDSAPTWGPDHPSRLVLQNNLGNLLVRQDRRDEAEPLLRDTLAARRRVSGPDHPESLVAAANYARLREDQGHLEEAGELFADVLARFRRGLGDEQPRTLLSFLNLGGVRIAQQRFAEAEPLLRQAVAGFTKVSGDADLNTGSARRSLGRALCGLQRYAEAEVELLAAERTIAAAPRSSKERKLAAIRSLVDLYQAWHAAAPTAERAAALAAWQSRLPAAPDPAPVDPTGRK